MGKGTERKDAGGRAAAGGFSYQHRVTAWFAVQMLAGRESPAVPGLYQGSVLDIACETDEPVDDCRVAVATSDGHLALQVKHSIRLEKGDRSELAKTAGQFVRQHRTPDRDTDKLVLVTSPYAKNASKSVTHDLKDALNHLRECSDLQRMLNDSGPETDALTVFLDHVKRAWTLPQHGVTAPRPADAAEPTEAQLLTFLNRCWVFTLDVEEKGGGEREALGLLTSSVLNDGSQAHLAWDSIIEISTQEAQKTRLPRSQLQEKLAIKNIDVKPLRDVLDEATNRWMRTIERGLLTPSIRREDSEKLAALLRSDENRGAIVVGAAGTGKSVVLYDGVRELTAEGWRVIGLRLDQARDPGYFTSTRTVGESLGLGRSPVAALAAAAGSRPSLLVIDQVDAVSMASGRLPDAFDTIADLVEEAAEYPQMRVLLACRAFDVDNDRRVQRLLAEKRGKDAKGIARLHVDLLTEHQTEAAVQAMDLPAYSLTEAQRSLLRSPFHLKVLSEIAGHPNALSFSSSHGLLAAYWKRKEGDCRRRGSVKFFSVVEVLANAMSKSQRLAVSPAELGDLAEDAKVLASEHVLVKGENADTEWYAFFHESFFDYAFARVWFARANESLAEFLARDTQELFRRSQVRQILQYIRVENPGRFVEETEALLGHPGVRFHIKAVALAVVRDLQKPDRADWKMIERLLASQPGDQFTAHLWKAVCSVPWFDCLDQQGILAGLLDSGDETAHGHALDLFESAGRRRSDRLADLIRPYAGTGRQYLDWLTWSVRAAFDGLSRRLFDLLLDAVRRGEYNERPESFILALHEPLSRSYSELGFWYYQPAWAMELFTAWLAERPGAFDRDSAGRVLVLDRDGEELSTTVGVWAEHAPVVYLQRFVPYLLRVMELTETDVEHQPVPDKHFFRPQPAVGKTWGSELLEETANALRRLATENRPAVQPTLELLADDPHGGAQWLLYEALTATGKQDAGWAADLLLQGNHRFYSGYSADPFWTTRHLLQATTPHMSDEHFVRVETAILEFTPANEKPENAGFSSYKILTGMTEPRLSDSGKQRLAELRRKFSAKPPVAPCDTADGYSNKYLLPLKAEEYSSAEWWQHAMSLYEADQDTPETDYSSFQQVATDLYVYVEIDGEENSIFAKLALRLTAGIPPAYVNSLLGAARKHADTTSPLLTYKLIRHVAAFNRTENDRELSFLLRPHTHQDVPDDIVAIILDRALHAVSPAEGERLFHESPRVRHFDEDGRWLVENSIPRAQDRGWPSRAEEAAWNDRLRDFAFWGTETARGQAAVAMGDLVFYDTTGERARLASRSLSQLAEDPSTTVRTCVAYLLSATLRHATEETIAAFKLLIKAADQLLANPWVVSLVISLGELRFGLVEPVIHRMLASTHEEVRQAGGLLAAYAELEFGAVGLLSAAVASDDAAIRKGAAALCAYRLPDTANTETAAAALRQLMSDTEEQVLRAVSTMPDRLHGHLLKRHLALLDNLIDSPAFIYAWPRIISAAKSSPDDIDDIILHLARRHIETIESGENERRPANSQETEQISDLTVRAYVQEPDKASRKKIVDLIDRLVLNDSFGNSQTIDKAGR